MDIGEITPPAPGNTDFLCWFFGMIDHQHLASPLAGNMRAHQTGRPCTDNQNIYDFL